MGCAGEMDLDVKRAVSGDDSLFRDCKASIIEQFFNFTAARGSWGAGIGESEWGK